MEKTVLSKNAAAILIKLLEGEIKVSYLQEVVKNYSTLQLTIRDLEEMGYVKTEERRERGRVVYVSLTERGRAVAEKLKEAEEIARMSEEELERFRNMRALLHVNMYEDHVSVMDIHMGESRIANIYAKPKGHEVLFWCDLHDDTDCYHIEYMFADPKLSEFIRSWIERNGYRLPKKYDKYVEKYW